MHTTCSTGDSPVNMNVIMITLATIISFFGRSVIWNKITLVDNMSETTNVYEKGDIMSKDLHRLLDMGVIPRPRGVV